MVATVPVVAGAVDLDDVGVVSEAVDGRTGAERIAEHAGAGASQKSGG